MRSAAAGEAYIDFAAGLLDQPGAAKAQGLADGFRSALFSSRVVRDP